MLKRRLFSMLLLFMVLFVVSYAGAEMRPGVEFGIFGGSVAASAVSNYANIMNGNVFGLRLGGNFNRYVGIENAFALAGTKYTAPSAVHTGICLWDFNAFLQFPVGPVVPFATAGAGWALFIDYSLAATNYGAGLKLYLARHFFVQLDYKEYIVDGNHRIRDNEFYSDQIRLKEIGGGISVKFSGRQDVIYRSYEERVHWGIGGGYLHTNLHKQLGNDFDSKGGFYINISSGGLQNISFGHIKLKLKESIAASTGIVEEARDAGLFYLGVFGSRPIPIFPSTSNFLFAPTIEANLEQYFVAFPFEIRDELNSELCDQAVTYGYGIGLGIHSIMYRRLSLQASATYQILFPEPKLWHAVTLGIDGLVQGKFEAYTQFRLGANFLLSE